MTVVQRHLASVLQRQQKQLNHLQKSETLPRSCDTVSGNQLCNSLKPTIASTAQPCKGEAMVASGGLGLRACVQLVSEAGDCHYDWFSPALVSGLRCRLPSPEGEKLKSRQPFNV